MKLKFVLLTSILFSSFVFPQNELDSVLYKKAIKLSKQFIIVDTHVDVPYRLKDKWENISQKTAKGHFDYVRAKQGGLDAPFMSIYIPASLEGTGNAKSLADTLIDMVEGFQQKWPNKFAVAKSVDDVKKQFAKGLISLPMGMENGAPIEGNLKNLTHFYNRGIRYITLTHSKNNHIGDSSYDETRKWHGLSPFGVKLVKAMNDIGIMVDVSHISDDTFYQVIENTKVPVIASHSSCRHFTPDFERNMNDDMIKKLAANGGVIQINFGSYFVMGDYQKKMGEASKQLNAKYPKYTREQRTEFYKKFKKENNVKNGEIEDLVNHIDHVVKLVGINHVGFGSDYDGIGDLPAGLEDVSTYPKVIYGLLKKGYSKEDIEKICNGNIFRVWKKVEEYAKKIK